MTTTRSALIKPLKCDCCRTETLALLDNDRLIITDHRHGEKHILVLPLDKILELLNTNTNKRIVGV